MRVSGALLVAGSLLFFQVVSRAANSVASVSVPTGCFEIEDGSVRAKGQMDLRALNFSPRLQLGLEHLERVVSVLEKYSPEKVDFIIDREGISFNGYAYFQNGERKVKLNLGLLLNRYVTQDVLALVACHELGHHFGGAPREQTPPLSYEGQADFVATQNCFQYWITHSPLESGAVVPDTSITRFCRQLNHGGTSCARTLEASGKLAFIFSNFRRQSPPDIFYQDQARVQSTLKDHGTAQCRLDSFRGGYEYHVKPLFGHKFEFRPRCWYLPSGI